MATQSFDAKADEWLVGRLAAATAVPDPQYECAQFAVPPHPCFRLEEQA